MPNNIQKIKTFIPNSDRIANINIDGKNLIITGVNGCGKTQLINLLHSHLEKRVVSKQNHDEQQLKSNIEHYEEQIKNISKANSTYTAYQHNIDIWRTQLEEAINPPLSANNIEQFTIDYHEGKAVLLKFDATRQAKIREAKSAISKDDLIKQASAENSDTSILFEDYLVSHKTAQAYAESPTIDNNPTEAKKIAAWFDKLQDDFRELFEDPTLELTFKSSAQAFLIQQSNKDPYRLQQLSSGFSSILSIYANLLTRIELKSIAPNEVYGVVFIDEIDAHLHVSLQRKILSFLVKSFPKIQFIVTTHSPFVVSSVSDAVIYDLSTLEQIDDLSMYSYESILNGLFNVLPISEILKEKIIKLSKLLNNSHPNMSELETLAIEIGEHEKNLDSESAYFLKKAKIIINKVRSKEA